MARLAVQATWARNLQVTQGITHVENRRLKSSSRSLKCYRYWKKS